MAHGPSIHGIRPYFIDLPAMETIGDRIRHLRKVKGLSLAGLGKRAGIGKAGVFQWETGGTKNMKNETLMRVAEVLGTDVPYLLWGEDRKPPESPVVRPGATSAPMSRPKKLKPKP